VPYLDVTGTFSKENGNVCLFILNRDLTNAHEVDVIWEDAPPARILTSAALTGNDLKASNSFDAPQRVVPQDLSKPVTSGGHTKFEVPPRSYTVLQWSL
jgi:alpha-N-arabinofuranosidase